jgi:hypothetical protein
LMLCSAKCRSDISLLCSFLIPPAFKARRV